MTFYGSYYLKLFLQSKRGIKTDRMGKGSKPIATNRIEVILKCTTFLTAAIQVISVALEGRLHY